MLRKLSLFILSLSVFITLFIFGSMDASLAANNDTVYSRNGEVYVMIGQGTRMGVYASQQLVGGARVTKKPDGVKLFGDPAIMDNYQSLAVDQFRNIYVLSGKLDPGLITMPVDSYFPVDPPEAEGIVGVGNAGGTEFHDVINHCDNSPKSWHNSFPREDIARTQKNDVAGFATCYGLGIAPGLPPAAIMANYQAKYAGRTGDIRRIPLNHWYVGQLAWNGGGRTITCSDSTVTWQVKYNIKVQRINLWISHYVDGAYIPAGVVPTQAPDPVITPNVVNDMFEKVFNTTNIEYKRRRATGCGEPTHPGFLGETNAAVQTRYRLGFTTTGAGRRYVYSSLPVPKIKKGTIKLVAGNTFGIPQMDSADFTALNPTQPLVATTVSIGAATKNATEDYVYTAPTTDNGWDVIDFAVADQWDGTGGVRYMLLQAPGGNCVFNKTLAKKLKWNKMNAYTPVVGDPVKAGEIPLDKDVKAIAGDGSGSIYYLTDPRPVFDAASAADTFYAFDASPSNLKPLITPGKPDPMPPVDGVNVWGWQRKFSSRAATELHQVEYYTKTKTNLNNFTVGTENALVLEIFSDPNGMNFISRGKPEPIPPVVSDIKVALASINLAGPPTGNDEKMVADVVSSNATTKKLKDIRVSNRDGGVLGEAGLEGDEISEDTQYRSAMENAPLQFSNDLIKKNIISGPVLRDENGNGIKGGFDFAARPATACYYWRVEMVEPMKKVLTPDAGFPSKSDPAVNVTLNKLTAVPNGWAALAGKGASSQAANLADGYWYGSRGVNADLASNAENANAAEALPDFAFTPKEPGVYKVSLIASCKKWDYSVLGYPSYITDRETAAGCKDGKIHYLFFDDGKGGGIAGDGIMNGGEDYIAERYVVVTAKKAEPDKYITKISITGPSTINENQPGVWTASANIRFIKSLNHEVGTPSAKVLMETFNGVGHWDYPATAVADWGLPPFDGVGENYAIGAPGSPSNCYTGAGGTGTIEAKLRNFGEKPPGSSVIPPPPTITAAGAPVWGTSPLVASWVEGAGTNANPTIALNKADRGAIEYEWYLAAEQKDGAAGASNFIGATIPATSPSDRTRCPGILIAKGRLSDEGTFPGDATKKAVEWVSGYTNADRRYDVKVSMRYAFDMPLDPGNYYMYIKFKYPKLKWEGRSPKIDKDGNFISPTGAIVANKADAAFAYYDLVSDGFGETVYHTDNWLTINPALNEPSGFKVNVKDLQPPQAYFVCENAALNPDSKVALNAAAPAAGVIFNGATTGDPFPGTVAYKVCDNNPNQGISSSLMAKVGPKASAIAWKKYDVGAAMDETEDVTIGFDLAKVKQILEKTIIPNAAARPAGVIQDAVVIPVNTYPGYGNDAPYRLAGYKLKTPKNSFTKTEIPYDMTGNLPLYASGNDGTGNKMSDFDKNGQEDELTTLVNSGKDETKVNAKKFPNAPANIILVDNDAPSLRFYALRSRDNVYREYIVSGTGALTGARPAVHNSNYDDLDWDPTEAGKLRFTTQEKFDVTVKDCDLNGQIANIAGQNNPVHPMLAIPYDDAKARPLNKIKRAANNNEIKADVVNGKDSFLVKFNGASSLITQLYNDFSPVEMVMFDFDKILTGAGSTLEVIEDSRTRFEITIVDNVDGVITPSLALPGCADVGGNSGFVDTENLADADTLAEVMSGWRLKGTALETYGIFRNPTPLGNKPTMLLLGKDTSGNTTAMKIPMTILHTLIRTNVLNVESRRSQ